MISLPTVKNPASDGSRIGPIQPGFMMSFAESEIAGFIRKGLTAEFQRHNVRHITRVYPGGSRITSSNYDPTDAWNCGCQLVALNFQTDSEAMWLNDALFSLSAGCGYVLKPEWMLTGDRPPSRKTIRVFVICGGLTGGGEDVHLEVKVAGWIADRRTCETKTIWNGVIVNWNEEFVFELSAPEIDFLEIILWESGAIAATEIGHFVAPVRALRPGIHAVPLYAPDRQQIPGAFLLCRFAL
jgi:hypothetical protein